MTFSTRTNPIETNVTVKITFLCFSFPSNEEVKQKTKALCTIRSHGTKSHMLVRKLRSGRSCTGLEVPLRNLLTSMCDFVPCDRIV